MIEEIIYRILSEHGSATMGEGGEDNSFSGETQTDMGGSDGGDIINNSPPTPTTSSSISRSTNQDDGDQRDAYEFVAFLLWYLFLVICCVLPTCCAYRRRRLMEGKLTLTHQSRKVSYDIISILCIYICGDLHMAFLWILLYSIKLACNSSKLRLQHYRNKTQ